MRIGIYAPGNTWGSVSPEGLEQGLGGRESAGVYLAEAWGDRGHDVTVFAQQKDGRSTHYKKLNGGATHYVDTDLAVPMVSAFQYDAFLSWEVPEIYSIPNIDIGVKLCGLQVAHVWDTDPELVSLPDAWVALSPWHKEFMELQTPYMREVHVQPNGVRLSRYPERIGRKGNKDRPYEFLYASSPDRGLVHLLRSWQMIRSEFPDAVLHIAYGIEGFVEPAAWSHNIQGETAVDINHYMRQPGISYLGKIGQTELAQYHSRCDALLYPCDPFAPTETGCITVIEACAAGNVPIITNADCLPSEFSNVAEIVNLPFHPDTYIEAMHRVLDDPRRYMELQRNGRRFAQSRDWKKIADGWLSMIAGIKKRNEKLEVARV